MADQSRAKMFLKKYQQALTDIRNLEAESKELENMAMSMTGGPEYANVEVCGPNGKKWIERQLMERVQSSGNQDPVGNLVAKICDMKLELMELRSQALGKLRQVEQVIAAVDDKVYRQLLHRRYIENNSWKQMSEEMNYSTKYIFKLHGYALEKIETILKEETK